MAYHSDKYEEARKALSSAQAKYLQVRYISIKNNILYQLLLLICLLLVVRYYFLFLFCQENIQLNLLAS